MAPEVIVNLKMKYFSEFFEVSNNIETPIRKFGSASLDLANVACGRFDGFWQRELNYWDIAAGIVIVKEAGGFVDFLDGKTDESKKMNIVAYKLNNS